MIRATLDTSVFVSALNFGGIPNEILTRCEADESTLCLSRSIIDELHRVLREGFEWSEEDLAEALDSILALAEIVEPTRTVTASRDPNDDHVLACALEAKVAVVVTGDNDLLSLGEFEGVRIVTPRQFIELLG
ncbi:MAG TPA: putative toxin-antitoxin system toxin component, PIN family [Bryobacteraceae bacterium]|nr:putative toxin-antitoxin system toxin component, PIN family [Bryobacteraceae bacterium]